MARAEVGTTSGLAYLREEALRNALLVAAVGLYGWCAIVFPSNTWFGPAWRGPILLAGSLALAVVIQQRHPPIAGATLILGLTIADLYTFWLYGSSVSPYLLAVIVGLTGLLFDLQVVLAATVACAGMVLGIGRVRWGYPLYAAEMLAPLLVIGAVGILTSLSVHNLYTALHWAWDRTLAAQRNQDQLRERRAELARTAKALDEACQRLELMNYDLARAREAAEEARLLKQQFTTSVSHELRAPLNVIMAFSEMMYLSPESYGGTPLPPEYRGDVREIYRASQHLLRLVDDVLDLSQIESQRMRIQLEPVPLADVIDEALEIMRPLVRGKPIELRTEIPSELPLVLMDRARIRQVLLNLLNNARRFTQQGAITVHASLETEQIRVTVADTGIGIAPHNHEKVFEEFRQLDGSTTRQQGGTGLGLAISRRFVEMHGGRIWVESEGIPGQGSQFHFTLPLAGVSPVTALQRTPWPLTSPPGHKHCIVVLGKDEAITHLLERSLEGYQVIPVESTAALPALAEQAQPQAVVVTAATERRAMRGLRQALAQTDLPAIFCPLVAERQLGQALGAIDYLVKPVARQSLVNLLDRLGEQVRRILIVDDDQRMARVLSRMIRSIGRPYEIGRSYKAMDALAQMRRQPPDLLLLDLILPEVDGRTLLARMHQDPTLCRIPVVLISALQRTPEEERRLGGRVLSIYSKDGFTNEEATHYLRGLLEGGKLARAARRSA